MGMKRVMVKGLREEKAQLSQHLDQKYGTHDPNQVQPIMLNLRRDIEAIESQHKPEILGVIRDMIQERYGEAVTGLKIGLTSEAPSRVAPTTTGKNTIPGLPGSLDKPMIYRTEVRNLWQQGEGWIGMKEFGYGKAQELNAISPGLAEKYQELDKLNRWGQIFVLAFKYGMTLLFDSSFEKDPAKQEEAKQFLHRYGVFP